MSSWVVPLLLLVICLQFIGLLHLLSQHSHPCSEPAAVAVADEDDQQAAGGMFGGVVWDSAEEMQSKSFPSAKTVAGSGVNSGSDSFEAPALEGVAAIVLLHAPKWFQRRYSYTIMNALNNLPCDKKWTVQVFYAASGQSQAGIDLSRGLARLVEQKKVVLSPIPPEVLAKYAKKFEIMQSKWLWENMLAEKVLIFGGNSVICSNSKHSIADFASFDYIGSPWDAYGGAGGDGGISIRSKKLMLQVLEREMDLKSDKYKPEGREDLFFMSRIQQMQKAGIQGMDALRIATREDTQRFSAVGSVSNEDVLAVSGTLPGVLDKVRETFILACPEMKIMFPAVHSPHCYGSHVDSEKCAASICATSKGPGYKGSC